MNKTTKEDIFKVVWRACDTFRGVIDPAQYKDYVLTMLFIKYVSDVWKDKMAHYLEKYDGDKERAEWAMRRERFVVPPHSRFDYLYEHRNEANIGELINQGLEALEEENPGKLSGEDGSGVFRNIDFNTSNLGDVKDKNTRLKNLLIDFSDDKLDLRPSRLDGSDIIGDAYEFLISHFASDAGKKAGEFYTPKEVSTLVARLTKSQPGARICDPTCGSGSLLIKAGKEVGSDNFSLYGQEANGSTWALAVMNMFLHGMDNATIRWGDTIRNPKLKEGDTLMKFDTVVANPPFSLDKWGAEDAAADPHNRFWRGVPPKSKGDWAFISHMIETAYEGKGKVGVVVPHGVLFRGSSEGKIRQKTIEENLLETVIGLPANLFFGTGIPAAILVFNKGKGDNKNVLFIDASQHYEQGKNQNRLRDEDIQKIVDTHRQFEAGKLNPGVVEEKFAYVATFEEIKENEFNLNIPRYVDTFEEEEEVDLKAVQQRIAQLEKELSEVQGQMADYLKELGLN
ncbi:MAG: type I restriction-modification system subunit M [Bacteroidetes bacterium]|nr:MAG: type I restriction-modification system subunit M [Bacteroidota bacterium]